MERAAGILLAVSSLPSPYGIGSFGTAGREWCDFLAKAGQKYWQILPLGPTGWGNSPYQSFSAFAVSSYYIDLDTLASEGLLKKGEAEKIVWGSRPGSVNYGALYHRREKILRLAFEKFRLVKAFKDFREKNAFWLEDYSLFMALKKANQGKAWLDWEEGLRFRKKDALAKAREDYIEEIDYHVFVQYQAFRQWSALKHYANSRGISIIGDMPIYVSMDSSDTWANSDLFQLDKDLRPIRVSGCPPDPFAADGQLWGNPLYRWDYIRKTNFAWWILRLRESLSLYDVVRIDHFRGFESYYSILAADKTAANGEWVKGPGLSFINAVNKQLPGAAIIAEDLGYLTPEVKALLKASGYPGMKVLQFAFDSRESGDYMPHSYIRNCVVYTGTHDNTTSMDWFKSAPPEDAKLALDYFGLKSSKDGNWAYIRTALSCVADLAVIPLQDYLGLGKQGRMNAPSTLGGNNWCWRLLPGQIESELAVKIKRITDICGR
ncbi:4-alpha-glucanotransferase [Leadbettera azotonutricia]|uniref:4-alpha-glucanotransferase n=1 Tax=Leadbettera azotonutricia (strain ATCC BAA-888 / DSM 13862 / ZAS-9) TaxID=545695 RepID=F5YBZ3_LEAAZ|nr:4-alpha-glucanotransferase [Leadbettera azotonutricia]AEF80933.1 4-alpha-glucanotransferase [Leadbettera azotonutricia ZAS-9]